MNTLRAFLSPYQNKVEPTLDTMLPEADGLYRELYGMLRYHLGWVDADFYPLDHVRFTGKRIRAIICIMVGEIVGGQQEDVLLASVAIELLHEFSLIHDDIEDGDQIRRHRPTLWRIWDVAQAINAGDVLLAIAQQTIMKLAERNIPHLTVCEISRRFNETIVKLCCGQHLDISFESVELITPEQYLEMIAGKTAALLSFSAEAGAILGGGSEEQIAASRQLGFHLGIAFQLQDDLLGLWGDTKQTGKTIGSDLQKRKKSYPIVLALNHSSDSGEQFRTLYTKAHLSNDDLERCLYLMASCGVIEHTQELLNKTYKAADEALSLLETNHDLNQNVTPLRKLVSMLKTRTG